jgi:riboflavin synthase
MFTGIVEEVGDAAERNGRLRVRCQRVLERLAVGESINVQGACLTVVARNADGFESDLADETKRRTTFGSAKTPSRVNLERAATPHSALGGHFVQGHVDGTTKLLRRDGERLRFALDPSWSRYVAQKGFIALDGVSLTVASVDEQAFEIVLVPHTAAVTTLGALRPSDAVNVEVDILAKYVESLLAHPVAMSEARAEGRGEPR